MGPDEDPIHVGDDQERRVAERPGVLQELVVSRVEIPARLLGLPGEEASLEGVGEAPLAGRLGHSHFEGEIVAFRVELARQCVADDPAEIKEELLRGRFLGSLGLLPFPSEGGGIHVEGPGGEPIQGEEFDEDTIRPPPPLAASPPF